MGLQVSPQAGALERVRAIARAREWWLPVAIGIAGVFASFLVYGSLRRFEARNLTFIADAEAERAAADLQKGMGTVVETFVRIALRHGGMLRAEQQWELSLPGLTASLWVEPSGKVRWVIPLASNEHLAGADLAARDGDRAALLRARSTGKPTITPSAPGARGDSTFRVIVPFLENGAVQGFVVAVISSRRLYAGVLDSTAPDWALAVFDGGQGVYQRGPAVGGRWLGEAKVVVLDAERRVLASPGPAVAARMQGPVPTIVLAAGSAISLLLAMATGLARTARRRARDAEAAEAALRGTEARMESIVDAALDAVITIDADGLVVSWNARAETLLGYRREEAVGRLLAEMIIPARYRAAHTRGLERFRATGEAPIAGQRLELSALKRDGSEFPIELTVTALRERGFVLFTAFVADITDRKRSEEALLAAQRRLAHVVASSPAVLYSLRVEGGVLRPEWLSPNVERLAGYPPEEIAEPDWWAERLHPDDRDRVMAQVPTLLAAGHVTREYRFRVRDGSYRWVRDEQVVVRDVAGKPVEVVGSWSDVTAQKEAELKAEASEAQYRLLFDSNPQPMWVFDEETRAFLAVNDAAIRHYGYSREEFLSMTDRDIRPPEERPAHDEFVAERRRSGITSFRSPRVWKHIKKDGSLINVKVAVSQIAFQGRTAMLVLIADVTEEKRLEAQLLQSQKMESVGRLAGGVAHDFNNLLGVITGYGELLQRDIGPSHPAYPRVEEIRNAADRAAGLTRQLLAFSRKQILELKVLDLNAVVADTERMLRRLIGEDIDLVTSLEEGLGSVKADPGQMAQVIVNLAVNARDAMPNGGKLILETANVELDEGYTRTRADARIGPHVMLAVSDTGHGMNEETLSHLFEPFFTTKEQGKGTGLGLATVHGIVRQSGGHVMVYSEPGQGTTFKVYLPRVDTLGEEVSASPAAATAAPLGTETILLVEDESSLRVMVAEVLEAAGYVVLENPTPEEALATAGSHRGGIALLLTDVILPRMSGRQLAEAVRSSRPEVRVMFMSGYTADAIGHQGILDAGNHFLQKPFTTDGLLRKVREALDAPLGDGLRKGAVAG